MAVREIFGFFTSITQVFGVAGISSTDGGSEVISVAGQADDTEAHVCKFLRALRSIFHIVERINIFSL
jgi:hypothetical protein